MELSLTIEYIVRTWVIPSLIVTVILWQTFVILKRRKPVEKPSKKVKEYSKDDLLIIENRPTSLLVSSIPFKLVLSKRQLKKILYITMPLLTFCIYIGLVVRQPQKHRQVQPKNIPNVQIQKIDSIEHELLLIKDTIRQLKYNNDDTLVHLLKSLKRDYH